MSRVANEIILSQLNWRYAVKKFDSNKKISAKDWTVLEDSLILSPSSYGLQPWRFLNIQDPKLREQLRPLSWNQSQITEASHLVVFTYKQKIDSEFIQKHIDRVATVRGIPVENLEGYKKSMLGDLVNGPRSAVIESWAQRQCYIAMGFIMEAAALLEIDTCALEGLDPLAYDKILNLEGTGWATVAALACGYRSAEDNFQKLKKVRFAKEDIIKTL